MVYASLYLVDILNNISNLDVEEYGYNNLMCLNIRFFYRTDQLMTDIISLSVIFFQDLLLGIFMSNTVTRFNMLDIPLGISNIL